MLILAKAISAKIAEVNASEPTKSDRKIEFVRSGAPVRRKKSNGLKVLGLLEVARDWECDFDLPEYRPAGSQYVFPHAVCVTPLKVDGHIVSRSARVCIVGPELTAPMEDNVTKRNTEKCKKYSVIQESLIGKWEVHVLVLEVGSRGWIPDSFADALRQLGFSSSEIHQLADQCSLVSRRCSYAIWLNRYNKDFKTWRISA
jgi:hypothetical protein